MDTKNLLDVLTAVRHFADLPTFLVATCVCLLVYIYLQRPRNLPPGPRGWPLLGNLPMLRKSAFLPATLTELSKQYGDVMTTWNGRTPTIVLTGYETIRTALVKRAGDFSSRRANAVLVKLRGDGITADGILYSLDGPRLKHLRKFTLKTFRDFGVGKRTLEDKVNEEANILVQEVLSQNGQPFDIKIMMQNAVCNIIFSIVFGDRLDYDNPDFLRLISLLNTAIETKPTISDILTFILPVFRHLQSSEASLIAKVERMYQALREFCSEQIQKHRLTFDPYDIRDFLDSFLLEQHRATDDRAVETFTDKQLKEVLIDLFLAGTETTATTTRWALLYMMLNPNIQEKGSA
uniref:Uncharacterized protein n=1 Tax=Branchiostoma floridae TaxID=7739 RepID=C3ZZ48_BRAFL|eukprot:XP_002586180.1 hypothetical protein BRAFLDRAFT_109682 [Branchiostoma floridae]